jgi:hypothetical protein
MIAEITRIDQFKKSRNPNEIFKRVYFKLENGSWAKTDLVIGFRNYRRWEKILKIGNVLFNLKMKDEHCVDADSYPRLLEGRKRNLPEINLNNPREFSKVCL